MKLTFLITAIVAPMWISASAHTAYFQTNFKGKKFPKGMTVENKSAAPEKSFYKNGYTSDGWIVEESGNGYAAFAPSYSGKQTPADAWMQTPSFNVAEAGSWLRWSSRSMLPGFPESYEVKVLEAGNGNWQTIYSVDADKFDWHTHLVSLDKFTGKEISVAFVCTSVDKYMLAVKDVFAGMLTDPEWEFENLTSPYAGINDEAIVRGYIRNIGGPAFSPTIYCEPGEGGDRTNLITNYEWGTNDGEYIEFTLPKELNEASAYTVGVTDTKSHKLESSEIFVSHFARTLLVDEGTGMWCNNCPKGILELAKLKKKYGDQMIELCCHANDLLTNQEYWDSLHFVAVPYLKLNRNAATAGSDTKKFSNGYHTPTIASLSLSLAKGNAESEYILSTESLFASDIDNSSDRYRIGYTVKADIYRPDLPTYYQQNDLKMPSYDQYYFLPSMILTPFARFENVVCSGEYAFKGVEGSLPAQISAMTPAAGEISISIPEIAAGAEKTCIVAFIIDTETGMIENAAEIEVSGLGGIGSIGTEGDTEDFEIAVSASGTCSLSGFEPEETVTLSAADATGRTMFSRTAAASEINGITLNLPKGLSIITVRSHRGMASAKTLSL